MGNSISSDLQENLNFTDDTCSSRSKQLVVDEFYGSNSRSASSVWRINKSWILKFFMKRNEVSNPWTTSFETYWTNYKKKQHGRGSTRQEFFRDNINTRQYKLVNIPEQKFSEQQASQIHSRLRTAHPFNQKIAKEIKKIYDQLVVFEKFKNSSGLEYESRVYRKVKSDILDKQVSPNFVRLVASCSNVSFTDLKNLMETSESCSPPDSDNKVVDCNKNFKRNIRWFSCNSNNIPTRPSLINNSEDSDGELIDIEDYDEMCGDITDKDIEEATYSALVTEKSGPESLSKLTRDRTLFSSSDTFLPGILFQVMYSIFALNDSGIQHNDLHWENILVDISEIPTKSLFVLDEKHAYIVESKYEPKIYDYDNSFIHNEPNAFLENLGLSGLPISGLPEFNNVWQPGRDIVKFSISFNRNNIAHSHNYYAMKNKSLSDVMLPDEKKDRVTIDKTQEYQKLDKRVLDEQYEYFSKGKNNAYAETNSNILDRLTTDISKTDRSEILEYLYSGHDVGNILALGNNLDTLRGITPDRVFILPNVPDETRQQIKQLFSPKSKQIPKSKSNPKQIFEWSAQ